MIESMSCKGCGKEFDPNAYGSGRKYCSPRCKFTEGGLKRMPGATTGRPRRFARMNAAKQLLVKHELQNKGGFELYQVGENDLDDNAYTIIKGSWLSVRICIGGAGAKSQSWAHTIAVMQGNNIVYRSACIKTKNEENVPDPVIFNTPNEENVATVRIFKRIPCEKTNCVKCGRTRALRAVIAQAEKEAYRRSRWATTDAPTRWECKVCGVEYEGTPGINHYCPPPLDFQIDLGVESREDS